MTNGKPTSAHSRRRFLKTATGAATLAATTLHAPYIMAQPSKVKVGFLLPYTGTYAKLGTAITDAFKLHVDEHGGIADTGIKPDVEDIGFFNKAFIAACPAGNGVRQ